MSRLFGVAPDDLSRVRGRERVLQRLRQRDSRAQPDIERLAHNTLERFRRIERERRRGRRSSTSRTSAASPRPVSVSRRRLSRACRCSIARGPSPVTSTSSRCWRRRRGRGRRPAPAPADHPRPGHADRPRPGARPRASGQRAALVGTPARPLGWLTLKDLVEEITGEAPPAGEPWARVRACPLSRGLAGNYPAPLG